MARVIIIGGHGKVAMQLHPMLIGRGDEPTGVIRDETQADDLRSAGAIALVADVEALDVDALTDLLRGYDAVVWTAGAGGGDPDRTYAVDRDSAIRTMDAAAKAGVRRYVMVSYFGAGPDHGVPPDSAFFPYAEAKGEADQHLRESELAWTVLGPSTLTLEPGTGRIEVGEGPGSAVPKGEVPRADVAAVIAETLRRDDTVGRTIEFNTGATPVADALALR